MTTRPNKMRDTCAVVALDKALDIFKGAVARQGLLVPEMREVLQDLNFIHNVRKMYNEDHGEYNDRSETSKK